MQLGERVFRVSPVLTAIAAHVAVAGSTFNYAPTAVWDGDGPIWCAEGPMIRIAQVEVRKFDGRRRSSHSYLAQRPVPGLDAGVITYAEQKAPNEVTKGLAS